MLEFTHNKTGINCPECIAFVTGIVGACSMGLLILALIVLACRDLVSYKTSGMTVVVSLMLWICSMLTQSQFLFHFTFNKSIYYHFNDWGPVFTFSNICYQDIVFVLSVEFLVMTRCILCHDRWICKFMAMKLSILITGLQLIVFISTECYNPNTYINETVVQQQYCMAVNLMYPSVSLMSLLVIMLLLSLNCVSCRSLMLELLIPFTVLGLHMTAMVMYFMALEYYSNFYLWLALLLTSSQGGILLIFSMIILTMVILKTSLFGKSDYFSKGPTELK